MFCINVILGVFIFKYLLGFIYSFDKIKYLTRSKLELTLLIITSLSLISFLHFNLHILDLLGGFIKLYPSEYLKMVFLEFCLFMFILLEIGKLGHRLTDLNMSPSLILLFSFGALILIGSMLLMMPKITASGRSMDFIDALFTSISASCVTGLIVVDTATFFSLKGQFIIMILIQLGGINIISFATIFAMLVRDGIRIKHQTIIKDNLNSESIRDSRSLIKKVFVFTLLIESIGAVLIFFLWDNSIYFENIYERVFYSVFHSISAFNNSGFSIFSDGLFQTGVREMYSVHLVIGTLIFFGGIGFSSLEDLFSSNTVKSLLKYRLNLCTNTKFSIYTSLSLVLVGSILIYVLEYKGVLKDLSQGGKIVSSVFQSITTRTAGFNTVDISILSTPVLIMMSLFMFIGASPGSTGGGIKTSTIVLLFMSTYATIRGKNRIETSRYNISFELVNKSVTILLFSLSFIFVSVFLLSITDGDIPILKLVFEEISAFATTGLSMGITNDLSICGRIIIMVSMFIGRVGALTLAFALSKKLVTAKYEYPETHINIG
ncbi:potassium uptake protein, integral membrane component, KtrB [Ichthyobacterium seriolicida]|uniref:Potassium uptake protein, integral membrane component, KtrB n=2 Tax=Ichthyobacterium seriolicida TaxID=242600 RepID=A0A1J1E997_9FLAO|nr:potassium uptake protein, integral membrane component, KtrB [Ichthyobacterium seriolicida]